MVRCDVCKARRIAHLPAIAKVIYQTPARQRNGPLDRPPVWYVQPLRRMSGQALRAVAPYATTTAFDWGIGGVSNPTTKSISTRKYDKRNQMVELVCRGPKRHTHQATVGRLVDEARRAWGAGQDVIWLR
jgi:hypothetical protein